MKRYLLLSCLPFVAAGICAGETNTLKPSNFAHTYSIVCFDSATGEFGAAVQSHYFRVADVIWAEAGVGVVATQSMVEVSYGPLGLNAMREGIPASQALADLLKGGGAVEIPNREDDLSGQGHLCAAGVVFLANHAMMGTPDGVLNHTQSSRSESRYWYNGVETGEIGQSAIVASYYGVPPIMVTGDEATCREAAKFFGPECVTVATKRGIARESAELYPFEETHQALYEGARRAVAAIGKCKSYKLSLPIQAKKEHLVFDDPGAPGRPVTKEGAIEDVLKLLEF